MSTFNKDFANTLDAENAAEEAKRTISLDEVMKRFGTHILDDEDQADVQKVRNFFKDFAIFLDIMLPPGRAKAIALTELETCSMWSVKAIVEHGILVGPDQEMEDLNG